MKKKIAIQDLSQGDTVVMTNKGYPASSGDKVYVISDPWKDLSGTWKIWVKWPHDYQSVEASEDRKEFYI